MSMLHAFMMNKVTATAMALMASPAHAWSDQRGQIGAGLTAAGGTDVHVRTLAMFAGNALLKHRERICTGPHHRDKARYRADRASL